MVHVIRLLHRHYKVTVIPNENETSRMEEPYWKEWLKEFGVGVLTWDTLPPKMNGWGLTFCNGWMLAEGRIDQLRDRGLKFAWSNDMMWHIVGELGLIMAGTLDHVIYVSEVQRLALEPLYRHAWTGLQVPPTAPLDSPNTVSGSIASPHSPKAKLRWVNTGNYIDPAAFPFVDRWRQRSSREPIVVGRLSRPDPAKFPEDFPTSYEGLGLKRARFSVMGWSAQVAGRWPQHHYDDRWTLMEAQAMPSVDFLQTLDLFVYDLSGDFRESWGRVVVEAMLTGAIPIVPRGGGHHFDQLVPHGKAGFLCSSRAEFGRYARMLEKDPALCAKVSRGARHHAAEVLNNAEMHRGWWDLLFKGK